MRKQLNVILLCFPVERTGKTSPCCAKWTFKMPPIGALQLSIWVKRHITVLSEEQSGKTPSNWAPFQVQTVVSSTKELCTAGSSFYVHAAVIHNSWSVPYAAVPRGEEEPGAEHPWRGVRPGAQGELQDGDGAGAQVSVGAYAPNLHIGKSVDYPRIFSVCRYSLCAYHLNTVHIWTVNLEFLANENFRDLEQKYVFQIFFFLFSFICCNNLSSML